jgi:hypothetical protein
MQLSEENYNIEQQIADLKITLEESAKNIANNIKKSNADLQQ